MRRRTLANLSKLPNSAIDGLQVLLKGGVAIEVFQGNTADPTTFTHQINKLRTRFGLEQVIWVGDRGINRLSESLIGLKVFDEDDWAGAQLEQVSVLKSIPSQKARSKANTKRTIDEYPVHSFQTLLADLATIAKNEIQSTLAGANFVFDKITEPTRVQQKALDLLHVSLFCTQ